MNEEIHRRDIAIAYEYSYLHDDWVHPLQEALDGLTAQQALWRSIPEGKCIWEIVLHMAVWHENIVERVESGKDVHPVEGAWPPLTPIPDETAWQSSQKRLWDALDAVREMIATISWDQIEASPYGLPDIICRLTHNGYHLGQIEKLREFMGAAS